MQQWLPMSAEVRAAIDRALSVNPVIGNLPIFTAPRSKPRPGEAPEPWSRFHARALLDRAEAQAKVPKLDGSDFHAYRRKWATERKHLSPQDVAAAGGWRDLRCLQTAYIQTDERTVLTVATSPTKLRDAEPPSRPGDNSARRAPFPECESAAPVMSAALSFSGFLPPFIANT